MVGFFFLSLSPSYPHLFSSRPAAPPLSLSPQAEIFEEIPTMDFPFHGMPTVPPRKDMSHMV